MNFDKSRTAHNILIVSYFIKKTGIEEMFFVSWPNSPSPERRSSMLNASDLVTRGSGVQNLCSEPLSEDVEPAPWEA